VALIEEDRRLTESVRIGLSKDSAELEVSFAADFFDCFKDYLLNKLSAEDYKYFAQRFDKFKTIWNKYAYVDRLNDSQTISKRWIHTIKPTKSATPIYVKT